MKQTLRSCIYLGCVVGLTMLPLRAQENSYGLFTAAAGAGFDTPIYRSGSNLDMGWNFRGDAGINLFAGHLGLLGEFGFDNMGVTSSTLASLGYPGGTARVYDFSGEAVIRFYTHGRGTAYLIGGPGVYTRTLAFTAPTIASVTGFSPFFGIYNVGVPANVVLASYTTTKLGVDGGLGFDFRLGNGRGKFFAEARYTQMYTNPGHPMAWIPVTFGFRW